MPSLRTYEPLRGVEPLGEMFRMNKGPRTALCTLQTHPLGWELTTTVNGELVSSEVCKDERRVFQVADVWRAALMDKGWTVPG